MKVICSILVLVLLFTSIYAVLISTNQNKKYRPLTLNEFLYEFSNIDFEPIDFQALKNDISELYDNRPTYDNKFYEFLDDVATLPETIAYVLRFGIDFVTNSYKNVMTVFTLIGKLFTLVPV